MDSRIKTVVILGGGTAGWMTASYLGKALQNTVKIVVLEAPGIPRIGVGEATVPNLQRAFFNYLGIAEEEWMRECNASYKMAVKFINWRTPGEGSPHPRTVDGHPDTFHHPFGLLRDVDQIPLSHYWAAKKLAGETGEAFDYSCFVEPALMDAKKAPRDLDMNRATYYAWHFDASLVAKFLRNFSVTKQGVEHVEDEMTEAITDEKGFITALRTKSGRLLEGDLFIDCSGFRGLLINKTMEEPFIDMSDHLLCDSAVATAIPHDGEKDGIEPYTSSIAMPSGWSWKIPMLNRFGSGYVFSSQFSSRDQATVDFAKLWGLDPDKTAFNQVSFRVGRNRRAWVRNCVSIGLASCFVEPLESSGIYFIYAAIHMLAKHFPDKNFDSVLSDRFNTEIEDMFDDTRDFLQAHYYFSPRTDTPFWKANKELKLADSILEKVETYRAGLPVNLPITDEGNYYGNFEAEFRNFWTNGSYYCIFAGLGMLPRTKLPLLDYKPESVAAAEHLFAEIKQKQVETVESLPSHYDLLRQLHGIS